MNSLYPFHVVMLSRLCLASENCSLSPGPSASASTYVSVCASLRRLRTAGTDPSVRFPRRGVGRHIWQPLRVSQRSFPPPSVKAVTRTLLRLSQVRQEASGSRRRLEYSNLSRGSQKMRWGGVGGGGEPCGKHHSASSGNEREMREGRGEREREKERVGWREGEWQEKERN